METFSLPHLGIELQFSVTDEGDYIFDKKSLQKVDYNIRQLDESPFICIESIGWFYVGNVKAFNFSDVLGDDPFYYPAIREKQLGYVDAWFDDEYDPDFISSEEAEKYYHEEFSSLESDNLFLVIKWVFNLGARITADLFTEDQYCSIDTSLDKLQYSSALERLFAYAFLFKELNTKKYLEAREGDKINTSMEKKKTGMRKPKKSAPKKQGYIYLVELDGCLKLGFSTSLKERVSSYKTGSVSVTLIAQKQGTMAEEKRIHRELKGNLSEKYPKERKEEILNRYFKGVALTL